VSTGDETFRAEFRAWLTAHPAPRLEIATNGEEAQQLRRWQMELHADRWVGIHWPNEYGGRGTPLQHVAIYNEELARAATPPLLGRAGISLVGPTLMAHGIEAQRSVVAAFEADR